jgi:hypothetical protein
MRNLFLGNHTKFIIALCLFNLGAQAQDPIKFTQKEFEEVKADVLKKGDRAWESFATPQQIQLFEGKETVYPEVSRKSYDLSGFDASVLGSKLPKAGVHPRIFFSENDIPAIRKRLNESNGGQKLLIEINEILNQTILSKTADEGVVFRKLVSGDIADLKWPESEAITSNTHYFVGYKRKINLYVHTGYFPWLLTAASFQALLNNDDKLGKDVAAAVANYWKLREPLIDFRNNEMHKSKRAPNDFWREMHPAVANNNLGFSYDFSAKWMNEQQKTIVRRVISKATKGKMAYGMNGPKRWAETNWSTWDLELYINAMAIDGEPGYDPAIATAAQKVVEGFLQWGINENGTIFETNGKNGGGFSYLIATMISMARHSNNYFGHPHFRKLSAMQAQAIIPNGTYSLNNGTWGNSMFGGAAYIKCFYPNDKCADFVMRCYQIANPNPDLTQYAAKLASGKLPSLPELPLCIPLMAFRNDTNMPVNVAAGKDELTAAREELNLPLDYVDKTHGLLYTRSGNDTKAAFLMFEARTDQHTVGHQHHDAGQFYFAALGEMWAVEAGPKSSTSDNHNTVQIDGKGYVDVGYGVSMDFQGANSTKDGVLFSSDITKAYNYSWTNPAHFSWTQPGSEKWKLMVETDSDVVDYFKGTHLYKSRIWNGSYWNSNWGPMMRIAGDNPVKYAFRSAGLVRGENPYALIIDDIQKDDAQHTYDWQMQLPSSVRLADVSLKEKSPIAAVLVKIPARDAFTKTTVELETLPVGTPALMVVSLNQGFREKDFSLGGGLPNFVDTDVLPYRLEQLPITGLKAGSVSIKNRLIITQNSKKAEYRVLLIPFYAGISMPEVSWDEATQTAEVKWKNQTDKLSFTTNEANRTVVKVERNGVDILTSH